MEWVACQGHPFSAYLFVLRLEVLFILIKNGTKIKSLEIFDYCYFYTTHAGDTTFFLNDKNSILFFWKFILLSAFSGLRPY